MSINNNQLDAHRYFSGLDAVVSFIPTDVPRGTHFWVQSVRDWVVWNPDSTAAPDDSMVIKPSDAAYTTTGRFIRACVSDPTWADQSDWYIDPVNGSDDASGATSYPIKSFKEFKRRIGSNALTTSTYVYILNDIPVTDFFDLNFDVNDYGNCRIIGTQTVIGTGTFTTFTAKNTGTGVWHRFTSAGHDTWADAMAQGVFIRCPIPANAGKYAYGRVVKDVGGGVAQVSMFYDNDKNYTEFTPAQGTTFDIVQTTKVECSLNLLAGKSYHTLRNLSFTCPDYYCQIASDGGAQVNLEQCTIEQYAYIDHVSFFSATNCVLPNMVSWRSGMVISGGIIKDMYAAPADASFSMQESSQCTAYFVSVYELTMSVTDGSKLSGSLGFEGAPIAIEAGAFGHGQLSNIWGTATDTGVELDLMTRFYVYGFHTLTGTTHEIAFDDPVAGTPVYRTWSQGTYTDETLGQTFIIQP